MWRQRLANISCILDFNGAKEVTLYLIFRWRCISIYCYNKTQHVSDSSSVHHQEFSTVQTTVVYVIQFCWQLPRELSAKLWHIPLLCVQLNSWWWTEELSETCRVLFQNKFEELVHLVCFISMKGATINGVVYEGVAEFIYLGTVISNDNSVEKETQIRILAGNRTYFAAISLFRSRLLSRATKIILYKTLIRPVVSYGAEAWTLTKKEEQAVNSWKENI